MTLISLRARSRLFRLCLLSVSIALPFFSATSNDLVAASMEVESLTLTIYFDGFTFVEYEFDVDPTSPTINVSLIGQNMEDMLITDGSGLPLDYSFNFGELVIHSLGATVVQVRYFTIDLTSKIGRYWTLQVDLPTNATIALPNIVSIMGLNVVPETIEHRNGHLVLTMPPGGVEITYTLSRTSPPSALDYMLPLLILVVASSLFVTVFYRRKKRKRQTRKTAKTQINAERLYREHQDLRVEEKAAIQVLIENDGKAFEAEIYNKLQLPRTTTWRMIKRLEKMEIITIAKFRRQNRIQIRDKYEIKKQKKPKS